MSSCKIELEDDGEVWGFSVTIVSSFLRVAFKDFDTQCITRAHLLALIAGDDIHLGDDSEQGLTILDGNVSFVSNNDRHEWNKYAIISFPHTLIKYQFISLLEKLEANGRYLPSTENN